MPKGSLKFKKMTRKQMEKYYVRVSKIIIPKGVTLEFEDGSRGK